MIKMNLKDLIVFLVWYVLLLAALICAFEENWFFAFLAMGGGCGLSGLVLCWIVEVFKRARRGS